VSQFFYWGCWGRGSGHRCLDPQGNHVSTFDRPDELNDRQLDGSYLPTPQIPHRFPPNQPLGVQKLTNVDTKRGKYTVLSMWDRSGDSRYGSHSNFVSEGEKTREEMKALIDTHFPELMHRILNQPDWPRLPPLDEKDI